MRGRAGAGSAALAAVMGVSPVLWPDQAVKWCPTFAARAASSVRNMSWVLLVLPQALYSTSIH